MPKVVNADSLKNTALVPGLLAFSRSAQKSRRQLARSLRRKGGKKGAKPAAAKPAAAKADPKAKKVSTRRWVAADSAPHALQRQFTPGTAVLRSNITPGTVLIVLAGRFRGKRVVFLKQLSSGLLLVTGPFKLNGVPLRRLNQAYVIATSKKVDVSGVRIPDSVNDEFFKRTKATGRFKSEEEFFAATKTAVEIPDERKAAQKSVDAAIKLDALTSKYLKAKFTLTKGQFPHTMTF